MPQPLDARVAAALKHGARLADCENALADVRAEREATAAARSAADERRLDPELSADEAAEAQLDMQEAELRLARLDRAEQRLVQRISEKRRAAEQAEAARRYDQIALRRAQLADDLKAHGRAALETLAGLCARIRDSDAEIAMVNAALPAGKPPLSSAEAEARGFAGAIWGGAHGMAAVKRLAKVELPCFDAPGTLWPNNEGHKLKVEAAIAEAEVRQRRVADAREASRARYVIAWAGSGRIPVLHHAEHSERPTAAPIERDLYPDQVDAARAAGFRVERWTADNAVWREYRLTPALDPQGRVIAELVRTRDGVIDVREPVTAWLDERQATDAREAGVTVELAADVPPAPEPVAEPEPLEKRPAPRKARAGQVLTR